MQVLSPSASKAVYQSLERRLEIERILQPRFVLTDKNTSLRTESSPLPVKANARLVVPGFKHVQNLRGELRRDAFTGSRIAQHVLLSLAASNPSWALMSADVRAAFLKGDKYVVQELYLKGTDPRRGPCIPIPAGCLAKVKKGVFGTCGCAKGLVVEVVEVLEGERMAQKCVRWSSLVF